MEINLISDTVTRPSNEMLQYMFHAKVGDDVFKQDPTVLEFEQTVAQLFGKEDALFFPSGTMANQTALKIHTNPGDEVICDKWSHIYLYEGGGAAANSGISCKLIDGTKGMITAQQVSQAINDPENIHLAHTKLVSIENTTNKGGGACYNLLELQKIKEICTQNNLAYHLDGARLWNALIAKKQHPTQFGALFDTISVCFSKGLGAPVGSVLLGSNEQIKKAYRVRKLFGGGMRQAGYLAAAGMYALQHNVARLEEDHKRAKELGNQLQQLEWVHKVEEVETNIVIFTVRTGLEEKWVIEKLKQKNIHISSMGEGKLRIVTHLDYKPVMHSYVQEHLQKIKF
ncbi:threonine aldolase family protein [Flavobacterium croceum]|uniref:threonine aldolase family protein n=1 Tax=Flavobacterium croceum TaxID=370975 RepID=UPI0024A7F653|nr:GntG family PLP-dependent aldolase [Flavobacterium croceum]